MLPASTFKTPNSKHQITNKSQIPIFNDQNIGISDFGHCDLFGIWDLIFGIYNNLPLQKSLGHMKDYFIGDLET